MAELSWFGVVNAVGGIPFAEYLRQSPDTGKGLAELCRMMMNFS